MKTHAVESLEELVFENRNKLYGAYNLRKKYNRRLLVSFLAGLFILSLLLSYPLIASYLNRHHRILTDLGAGNYDPIDLATNDPPPPPPPPPPPDVPSADKLRLRQPIVVDEETEEGLVSQSELESGTHNPPPPDRLVIEPEKKKEEVIVQPDEPPPPFLVVEEMPEFPGGTEALFRFLAENLRYPEVAKEINVTGKVFVEFVVEPDGTISNVTVLRGIGAGCDEEALRVVGMMPKWSPGKQSGMPVRVKYNLPVKFTLK